MTPSLSPPPPPQKRHYYNNRDNNINIYIYYHSYCYCYAGLIARERATEQGKFLRGEGIFRLRAA